MMKKQNIVPPGMVINVISEERADELRTLGFNCSEQKNGDGSAIYQFIATPELLKVLSGQFEKTDFFISKTMCL